MKMGPQRLGPSNAGHQDPRAQTESERVRTGKRQPSVGRGVEPQRELGPWAPRFRPGHLQNRGVNACAHGAVSQRPWTPPAPPALGGRVTYMCRDFWALAASSLEL